MRKFCHHQFMMYNYKLSSSLLYSFYSSRKVILKKTLQHDDKDMSAQFCSCKAWSPVSMDKDMNGWGGGNSQSIKEHNQGSYGRIMGGGGEWILDLMYWNWAFEGPSLSYWWQQWVIGVLGVITHPALQLSPAITSTDKFWQSLAFLSSTISQIVFDGFVNLNLQVSPWNPILRFQKY